MTSSEPYTTIRARCRDILKEMYSPPPPKVFHYTSSEGLYGILDSHEFRGSNYLFMNDRSEFTYGANLLRDLCKEQMNIATTDYERRYCEAIAAWDGPFDLEPYLASFCGMEDVLSQWRGYGGPQTRYCIEINPNALTPVPEGSPLIRVLYLKNQQREILSRILAEHIRGLRTTEQPHSSVPVVNVQCVYSCALAAFPFFKDETFDTEDEWRAVVFVQRGEFSDKLTFIPSSGAMKPQLPVLREETGSDLLPIAQIIASSAHFERQAIRAAELMLERFKYTDVKVIPSRVPLAG
jgi:hypothetical protein